MRKKLNIVLTNLNEVQERRGELYHEYLKVCSKPKKAQKVRDKIRPLDFLLETYFRQAFKAYKKFWNELEEIQRYKGFDKKSRVVYCSGEIHLVTSKARKFKYGFFCNCE